MAVGVRPASAQFAVIDVAAIVQAVQEVQSLAQQVQTAQAQLSQAQAELRALTGGRGMEQLLSGTSRNYLPRNWGDLSGVLTDAGGSYGALSGEVAANVEANRVLSADTVGAFSEPEQSVVRGDRRRAATAQALSREALAAASDRFAALQQLITAIGSASDPKAILDLQARIEAEEGMLSNEQLKVGLLHQTLEAEASARRERVRELALADIGSLRALPPLGLSVRVP